jgi:hypothetical protein
VLVFAPPCDAQDARPLRPRPAPRGGVGRPPDSDEREGAECDHPPRTEVGCSPRLGDRASKPDLPQPRRRRSLLNPNQPSPTTATAIPAAGRIGTPPPSDDPAPLEAGFPSVEPAAD